jgi:hypothetical protein
MSSPLREKIECVNAQIASLLEDTRRALTGECDFGVEQVRAISKPIAEMAPVMAQAKELRTLQPELEGQLDLYKSQIGELQTTLDQVGVMLLARRAHMEASRSQLEAVTHWAAALRQTR